MFEDVKILFISEKIDAINEFIKPVNTSKNNISIAASEDEAIELFNKTNPALIFLYHNTIEHSHTLYKNLQKKSTSFNPSEHQAIVLCEYLDFEIAYDKCIKDIFYDYIIMPPRLDKSRINLTIKRALSSIDQNETLDKAHKLSNASKSIINCNTDIENTLKESNTLSGDCDKSFDDLSRNLKTSIANNFSSSQLKSSDNSTESNQGTLSDGLDALISETIDKPIDASRNKVKSILEKHTASIAKRQKHFETSLAEVEAVSSSIPKRVLIIEDNEIYGEMVSAMLNQTKTYEVKLVSSIHQGLVAFVCDKPDIILLDFELEDGDANSFLSKIHEIPNMKMVPVIIITAHATDDVYTTTSMLGANAFIRKPASKEIIIDKIESLINK